jgi:HEAT repeat protein
VTPAQWKSLLKRWSAFVLATDLTQRIDPSDRGLNYLGFPAATASVLASLEERLGVKLPPSFRYFLQASDGFRVVSPFIYRLRSTNDLDWFRVENQNWVETYNEPTIYDKPGTPEPGDEEYYDYSRVNEHLFRRTHLFAMLQISEVGDGVMLLNPMAVTPDGEWEAWFFANWIPGAYRYASFAHMMIETYRSQQKERDSKTTPKLPKIKIPGPKVPRRSVVESPKLPKPKRQRAQRGKRESQVEFVARYMADLEQEEIAPAPAELFALLEDLKSTDAKRRAKSLRILRGKLRLRAMSDRHPDLVPLAAELAHSLADPESRCVCVDLLATITPDGSVPDWQMRALNDPHPWVQLAALRAVSYFKGPELVVPIAKIISEAADLNTAQSAAHALGEIPDTRAIAVLAAQLQGTPRCDSHIPPDTLSHILQGYYVSVALALARYGRPAVEHLTALLTHSDSNRRIAAIVGLRTMGDPVARSAVAKLKSDPDPNVRQQAELCDRLWGNMPGFEPHNLP